LLLALRCLQKTAQDSVSDCETNPICNEITQLGNTVHGNWSATEASCLAENQFRMFGLDRRNRPHGNLQDATHHQPSRSDATDLLGIATQLVKPLLRGQTSVCLNGQVDDDGPVFCTDTRRRINRSRHRNPLCFSCC